MPGGAHVRVGKSNTLLDCSFSSELNKLLPEIEILEEAKAAGANPLKKHAAHAQGLHARGLSQRRRLVTFSDRRLLIAHGFVFDYQRPTLLLLKASAGIKRAGCNSTFMLGELLR